MDEREIRLRCIEAAARYPDPRNPAGMTQAVLDAAEQWARWVSGLPTSAPVPRAQTLGLPKKGV